MRTCLPWLLFLTACGPDLPLACPSEVPALELTPSENTASTLQDGDETVIVFGPQGGHHVAFGIRVVDPAPRFVMRAEVDFDGEAVADVEYEGPFRGREGCTVSMGGFWAFLEEGPLSGDDAPPAPDLLVGSEIVLRATLTTESGTTQVSRRLLGAEMPR